MLSKNARNIILKTSVAMTVALASVVVPSYAEPVLVEAATVINQTQGTLTIKVASLWTYSKPDWNAKSKVFSSGTTFTVVEKLSVEGREMYRLSNGLYISANTAYVSFQASGGSVVPSPAPSTGAVVTTARTTANLNLRSGAGTGFSILTTIPSGAQVTVQSSSSGWVKVNYGGKTGYVSSTYLGSYTTTGGTTTPAPSVPTVPAETTSVTKTTVNLNLRSGAGTGYGILLTIPKGSTVNLISSSGGWTKVTYGSKTGWVSSTYLTTTQVSKPEEPAPTVPTPPTVPTVPTPPTETVSVTKTTVNLNLRSGAGTGYGILLTIPKGSTVNLVSTSGGWSKVTYAGKTGWVSSTYLTTTQVAKPEEPAPTVPEPPVTPTVPETPKIIGTSTTTYNLNMRSGAGTGFGILLTIPKGGTVSILGSSNGWSQVIYSGKTGYVSSQYLTAMVPSTPAPPETPTPETPTVEVKPAVLLLDDLKSTYDNVNIQVIGRAVTRDGVKSVTAQVNGKDIAVNRYERPELNDLYKEGYLLSALGFSFTIDKTTLSPGTHTLVVTSTANDGSVKTVTTSFRLTKPGAAISVAGITDGQAVPASNVSVSGYAVNVDGVSSVRYFVNGVDKGAATYGGASSVPSAYTAYTGSNNATYSFVLNAQDLSSTGMNAVRIELTGKDGNVYHRSILLKGSQTEHYIAEAQVNTRDYYAALEYARSVPPKISNGSYIVNATLPQVQFHLDPANYLFNETNRYMFMNLKYVKGDMNITGEELNKILVGMGVLEGKGQAFLDAAEVHGVNPFYLISHAILETGRGTSVLARGQYVTDTYTKFGDESSIVVGGVPEEDRTKLVYNVFGIGAWDINANLWGKQMAYTNKWFSVEEAIMGGAKWISDGYTNRSGNNQNTLFKMRYNFPENMGHEYATDLGWAQKQAGRIKYQIDQYLKENPESRLDIKFIYPTFKN